MRKLVITFNKKILFGKDHKTDLVIGMSNEDDYSINFEARFVSVTSKCNDGSYNISNYSFMEGDICFINEEIVKDA